MIWGTVASGGELVGKANGREVNNAHIVTYIRQGGLQKPPMCKVFCALSASRHDNCLQSSLTHCATGITAGGCR